MVFTIRVRRPQSIAGRSWNAAAGVYEIAGLALIVLRLIGVVAWSWWWVLAPLWIGGIFAAAVAGALLVVFLWARRSTG